MPVLPGEGRHVRLPVPGRGDRTTGVEGTRLDERRHPVGRLVEGGDDRVDPGDAGAHRDRAAQPPQAGRPVAVGTDALDQIQRDSIRLSTLPLPHWLKVSDLTDLKRDLIFRAAATQVIARPNYSDMTNSFWLADSIQTGGGGNPDLDPYESDNFNASLEWYLAPRAILSGEIFYKSISNYILTRTVSEAHFNTSRGIVTNYDISRPFNAGSAQVKGFAVAYQQSLPFGLGILANYTYSDGEGQDGADLPYNSRHQVSLSPFFETGPISIRGTYTWRSKYFTGIDRGDQMYVRDTANVDLSATYNITENIGLTISGMNLTDSEYYAYANTPRLPRGVYRTGETVHIMHTTVVGITGDDGVDPEITRAVENVMVHGAVQRPALTSRRAWRRRSA